MNRFQFFVVSCVGSGWLSLVLAAPVCFAQAKKATEEELTIPKPETMSLDTKDGVSIRCTYYPGGFIETAAEKEKVSDEKFAEFWLARREAGLKQ